MQIYINVFGHHFRKCFFTTEIFAFVCDIAFSNNIYSIAKYKIMIYNLKVLLTLPFYPPFFVVFLKVREIVLLRTSRIYFRKVVPNYNLVLRMICNTRHLSCNESRYDGSITICLVLLYYYLFIYER